MTTSSQRNSSPAAFCAALALCAGVAGCGNDVPAADLFATADAAAGDSAGTLDSNDTNGPAASDAESGKDAIVGPGLDGGGVDGVADGAATSDASAQADVVEQKADGGAPGDVAAVSCSADSQCAGKVVLTSACKLARCLQGVCKEAPAPDFVACDDGSLCTTLDACSGGVCVGKEVDCDDGLSCTIDGCDVGAGCNHLAKSSSPCDDGDACSEGDVCDKGACKPGSKLDCDDGNPCTEDGCGASNGCASTPVADGKTCDDGSNCSAAEACMKGKCTPTKKVDCDDGNPCTTEVCDDKGGCKNNPASGKCDDGNPCTVLDSCLKSTCQGAPKKCDDGKVCTGDICVPATGACSFPPETGAPCAKDNKCLSQATCKVGVCSGKAVDCDDGDPCTLDTCTPAGGCLSTASSGATCSDGDKCTDKDKCVGGKCKGVAVSCDDADQCTANLCAKSSGCFYPPISGCEGAKCTSGANCTDNDPCTQHACISGQCKYGPVNCDDKLPCTADSCVKKSGCVHKKLNSGSCDDGDSCTAPDTCSSGVCTGGAGICDDKNPCTDDKCAAGKCSHVAKNTGACDDGDKCSEKSNCVAGKCTAKGKYCDDGKPCTKDICDVAGCKHLPDDGASCEDGKSCTIGAACKAGACVGGKPRLFVSLLGNGGAGWNYTGLRVLADGSYGVVGRNANKPLIARHHVDGSSWWSKAAGSSSGSLYNLVQTKGGELVAIGRSQNQGAGGMDGWLVRINLGSVQLWSKHYGTAGSEQFSDGVAGGDGSVVAVGTQMSTTGQGNEIWVIKVDDKGGTTWSHNLGTAKHDHGNAIARHGADGFVIATILGLNGKNTGRIYRLDKGGKAAWHLDLGDDRWLTSIASLADGRIVTAGSQSGTFYPVKHGLIALLQPDGASKGKLLWATKFGTKHRWYDFKAVSPTADGGFVAAGMLIETKESKSNGLLAKFDAMGRWHWQKNLKAAGDGDGFETIEAIEALASGDLVIAGD